MTIEYEIDRKNHHREQINSEIAIGSKYITREMTIEYEIDHENRHLEQINSKNCDWEQVHHGIRNWGMTIECESRKKLQLELGRLKIF